MIIVHTHLKKARYDKGVFNVSEGIARKKYRVRLTCIRCGVNAPGDSRVYTLASDVVRNIYSDGAEQPYLLRYNCVWYGFNG